MELDALDRRIVLATQQGLPLDPRPYAVVAAQVGASEAEVLQRIERLRARGAIRRIGAVPNHYTLGYRANGMTVWDVDDDRVDELGRRIGALDFVSHCYRRPRHRPHWPYNLFAMVHGRDREEAERQIAVIADLLGDACRSHDVLYSTRILKKTGLRFAGPDRD
ncbi:MAG TPA: Lrp/AsnC family transcriptional regulator [Gammaproteobacteria bacterium]|nr:Lrp/AsnC family transcriptional regulator [Gammaproteobacteria bacterium]